AHFLGVPDDWTASSSGLLVREQKVIVYPETRTGSMLQAAESRMARLIKEREAKPPPDGKLSDKERALARELAVKAFGLAHSHKGVVHYTQGATRWQGIREKRRYADGRYPNYADCSSLFTWCWWNALTNVDGIDTPDIVNGSSWQAGYTGT